MKTQHRAIVFFIAICETYALFSRSGKRTFASDYELLLAADLWSDEPEIMSAKVGVDGAFGIEMTREAVIASGGAWNTETFTCSDGNDVPVSSRTGSIPPQDIHLGFDCAQPADHIDGFPICFSWPVVPSSVKRENFKITRSDGKIITPNCLSTWPNFEFNERHCVVLGDDFINRVVPTEYDSDSPVENGRLYVKSVEIVGPLLLVGPDGPVDGAELGLRKDLPSKSTPYTTGSEFLAARLIPSVNDGEGGSFTMGFFVPFHPNSGEDLYRKRKDQNLYRLRLFTGGGMSPDGVYSLHPGHFDDYFSVYLYDGTVIDYANKAYETDGGTLTVLGLAELGQKRDVYDNCYIEDKDNYIDIMIEADGEDPDLAISQVDTVLAFGKGNVLYNLGGPGATPTPGVSYTAPTRTNQTIPVNVDLERISEVSYCTQDMKRFKSHEFSVCSRWLKTGLLDRMNYGSAFFGSGETNVVEVLREQRPQP